MFIVKEEARQRLSNSVSQINVDVRHEIVTAPRPLTYIIGTVEDGCTLSGIARMFYGDAGKWKQIYEANRKTLKNPNLIESGIKLIIPATAVSTGVTHQNSK